MIGLSESRKTQILKELQDSLRDAEENLDEEIFRELKISVDNIATVINQCPDEPKEEDLVPKRSKWAQKYGDVSEEEYERALRSLLQKLDEVDSSVLEIQKTQSTVSNQLEKKKRTEN